MRAIGFSRPFRQTFVSYRTSSRGRHRSLLVPVVVSVLFAVSASFAPTVTAADGDVAQRRAMRLNENLPVCADFGFSLDGAGDVNGDGFDDFLVGAPNPAPWPGHGQDGCNGGIGRVYVYHGGPEVDGSPDQVLSGGADDHFGISVAGIGDVNGDGFDDVLVGADSAQAPGCGARGGAARLFYGGVGGLTMADSLMYGLTSLPCGLPGDRVGSSVAGAGDVDGDGEADVLVAAAGLGTVWLRFAYRHGYEDTPAFWEGARTLSGGSVGTRSVASAGDFNADGIDDIVIGGDGTASIHTNVTSDTTPDLVLVGDAGKDFGYSVAGAGDVNGDGFADVIVGEPGQIDIPSSFGSVYVYFGGSSPDASPDLVLGGEQGGDGFGYSTAGAGDVNGDGYADIIVGALVNYTGGWGAGRVYVFYGGAVPDPEPDVIITGTGDELLGVAVGAAGDLFGDGFVDVLASGTAYPSWGGTRPFVQLHEFNRYFVTSPASGDVWDVGATEVIAWDGGEPADVWLSVDGGARYERLRSGVGGNESNWVPLVVPHQPTRFARVKVTPTDEVRGGLDESDSLFTIQASIALLSFRATPPEGGGEGIEVAWSTEPGPEKLAGYRVEVSSGAGVWRTLVDRTKETACLDPDGTAGSRYRLTAINGLGEAYVLGETVAAIREPLAAWPQPYRGGELKVSFATSGGLGGGKAPAQVSVYDVAGRLVRHLVSGEFEAGYGTATWDGRDERGVAVSSGIYFLRLVSAGSTRTARIVVVR